nr:DUF262 domain-containing protein [Deinococcus budaensis]
MFSASQRYVIPIYQRRYVWTRDRQWAPLWQDIRSRADKVLARERHIQPHFLGAVVVSRLETYGHQLTAFDVIDGQQRLTTFQVFLAAFRDALQGHYPVMHDEAARFLVNEGLKASPEERFKVWPTRFDQPTFEQVVERGDPAALTLEVEQARDEIRHVPNLLAAYVYFHGELQAWLGEDPQTLRERADALLTAMRRYLQVVRIDLEEDDDPQVIFETLNARGEPLQPADLVRNHVFNEAARRGEDVEALFRTYWAPFDEDGGFWRQRSTRGRVTRDQLTWFLTYFLTVQQGREVTDGTIFDEFKRWWSARDGSVASGLAVLVEYAHAYEQWMQAPPTTRLGVVRRRLDAMDLSTLTPLLLWLLTREDLPPAELRAALDDLESFTVRRFVVGLGSKNYNQLFLHLLQALRAGGPVQETVRAQLLRRGGESVRWPGDDEVRTELVTAPTYKRLRPRGVGMLLEAVEMQLTTDRQEQLIFAAPPTVEHVLPRRWRQHWPPPAPRDGVADVAAWRDARLQNLGNLTLIRGTLNSSVSNKGYDVKRPALAEQSALRLNTLFQHQRHWDEDVIETRARDLAEQIVRIWPVPTQVAQPSLAEAPQATPALSSSLDAVIEDLKARPPHRCVLRDTDAGAELTVDGWSRSYKFLVQEDGEEGLGLVFREEHGQQSDKKAQAQQLLMEVGAQVELVFNEYAVSTSAHQVVVSFPGDVGAGQVRRALTRLLNLVLRLRARKVVPPEGKMPELDALAREVWSHLPPGYYLHGSDMGKGLTYRRIPNVAWPVEVHYELSWSAKDRQLKVGLDVELGSERPERERFVAAWRPLVQEVQDHFPQLQMQGSGPSQDQVYMNLKLALPAETPVPEIADTLERLIALTEAQVTGALVSPEATPA